MTLVYADKQSEPCMVLTEAVKGAAPSMRVTPPLILYRKRRPEEKTRRLTDEAQQIYDLCRFPDSYVN